MIKILFYVLIIGLAAFLYWFLPKYNFLQKNPGFCTELTSSIYYCGSAADIKDFFNPNVVPPGSMNTNIPTTNTEQTPVQ